jgi:lactoylglutathione lyase
VHEGMDGVQELRLVLTVSDFDAALALYRDALGLAQLADWSQDEARVVVLDAGHATIELVNEEQAELIDQVEVGSRVAGAVRIALKVADSEATAERLALAGAKTVSAAVTTPWNDRNVRMLDPEGMQLTLFTTIE